MSAELTADRHGIRIGDLFPVGYAREWGDPTGWAATVLRPNLDGTITGFTVQAGQRTQKWEASAVYIGQVYRRLNGGDLASLAPATRDEAGKVWAALVEAMRAAPAR